MEGALAMNRLSYLLALFMASGHVVAAPSLQQFGSMPMSNLFSRATTDYFNPDDLTFIKKLAAVGDSYSAGIGAGDGLQGAGGKFC
jgi:hypothetical protein